jgi:hypothetical protein
MLNESEDGAGNQGGGGESDQRGGGLGGLLEIAPDFTQQDREAIERVSILHSPNPRKILM